ncbi:glycoside hydrolase family 31 protein [Romboutsia lituseburensis]|uniref:glycoside hydrolase family 31 protein n=1 Tax=Romboutsia lituseburensis TaxID=1537 RepID=UPI00215A29E0|nr:glycoside hydrolase family 31 protein [Romboutsia lituseburensis]MCR8746578.1 glycoside hydrolase family 31 protein [Romboutsia lituseburensis]
MFGKIKNFEVDKNIIKIEYEKLETKITIINPSTVNFFVPNFRKEQKSKAIENLIVEHCNINILKQDSYIEISTDILVIKIYDEFKVDIYNKEGKLICEDYRGKREPFIKNCAGRLDIATQEGHKPTEHMDYTVFIPKNLENNTYFYGFGEKTGHLNKNGCHYINWNTDDPSPHGETYEKLYKSIPFFISMKDEEAFGIFFDNTFETHFDLGKENSKYYYFASVDGNIDYYFIYGPDITEVVKGYTNLTGTTPLPQLWTLGYQQCRWAYCPEHNVMDIAKKFREKDIPCDAIYLDIEYMDDFRVFTWDNKKFPNPKKMIKNLKDDGFRLVTIIDPGVKVDKGYKIYDEGLKNGYFATDKNSIVYTNWVWPGNSVFPDFMNSDVRRWWSNNQRIMLDYGVSGIWNDMNEPASFNGPLPDDIKFNEDGNIVEHKEVHNVYGHMMDKATYEGIKESINKRPFVVTRAAYSGTQKYSTVWTGDNQSTWEHLRMSIPMLMNLGLSGFAFCGTDVGGFGYDCTSELLSRWVQVGAFTPLFRNHTTIYSRDQEPWAFDKLKEDINRKYIKLRYKLIPYLYDTFYKGERDGLPVIRPLVLHYQQDDKTYEINDQFLFGENIMVAPVLEQGKKARMIYLPKGENWIDYWTKESFEGGQYIIKEAPLEICPIYIKEGSIIPNFPELSYIGEKEIKTLILDIYTVKDGEFEYNHYQDDGESFEYKDGKYNLYSIKVNNSHKLNITIDLIKNGYDKIYDEVQINLNGTNKLLRKFENNKVVIDIDKN